MKLTRVFVAVCLVLVAPAAYGVILVDYGDGAATPTLGGTWNTVDSGLTGAALVDHTGAMTGVSIDFGGPWIDASNDQGPWPSGDAGWVDGDATSDYTFNVGGDTSTVTFNGLIPGGVYRFEHVAAREFGADRVADYDVNGAFADSVPNGDDFASLADGWDGGNILIWEAVSAGSAGQLTLTVTDVQNFGYVSASMLEVVPEPAAGMMLLTVAVIACLRFRRR